MSNTLKDQAAELQRQPENYGYRVLCGEEARKVWGLQQPTDQTIPWTNCYCGTFHIERIYRRKIDPGEGKEIVGLDEVETVEMEFTTDGTKWEKNWITTIGKRCGYFMADVLGGVIAFRRPKSQPASDWHPLEFGKPETYPKAGDYPVAITDGTKQIFCISDRACDNFPSGENTSPKDDESATHWTRIVIPPLPEKQKTALEIAFLKSGAINLDSFVAGWNAKGGAK